MGTKKILPRLIAMLAPVVVFAAAAWGQTDETLYSFTGGSDGGNPLSSLVMDAAGNLYGTTLVGGDHGAGVVFALTPTVSGGWTESVVYSFTGGADGGNPVYVDLIFDAAGNLYGTTASGGTSNLGTVFELTPTNGGGWTEHVLYSFAGGLDGAYPYSGLVFDGAGNLYGTTSGGGASGAGTVFELTPGTSGQWTEAVIHSFNGKDGKSPEGGLTFDGKGRLYGATLEGGNQGVGVVFRLTPFTGGHWKETVLHSFTGGRDGGYPVNGRLVFDQAGNLYGTVSGGAKFQRGAVFSLVQVPTGWRERVLFSFEGLFAANPFGGLIIDQQGNLYGTCANGNGITSLGAVFEVSPVSGKWVERTLHLFHQRDGQFPEASLFRDTAGNLYGTTLQGGTYNMGVVFEVKP